MQTKELTLFLKRETLKPEAQRGGDITRRFAMNKVGRMIAAALQDRTIRLYDARNCEEIQVLNEEFLTTSIAFSPKGDVLASGSVGRVIKIWNIRTGENIATLEGHTYPILALSFSPDGDKLVSGSGDTTLITWDLDNFSQLKQLKGHSLYVVSAEWDPKDNRIVSSSVDSTICEWDPYSGNLLNQIQEHRTAVQVVRFTPDGNKLASGSSDHSIILWDATSSLKKEHVLLAHEEEVRALAFDKEGKYLTSGSSDKSLYVWSMDSLTVEGESSTRSEVDGIEWYPNELAFLTSDGTGAIARWEVRELEGMLAPFNELLEEIKSDPELTRKEEFMVKFEEIQNQYDPETLRDKRLFYVMWQCKKALGLLKGKVRR